MKIPMQFKLSLKGKALIGIIAILIPILITFILVYSKNRIYLKNRVLDTLTVIAESYEGQVYQFLERAKIRAQDFASDGFIRTHLQKAIHGNTSAINKLHKHLIKNKIVLDETINTISILSLEGRVVASTNDAEIGRDLSKESCFEEGKSAVTIVENRDGHIGLPEITISTPIFAKETGRPIGMIVNYILISELNKLLTGEYVKEFGAISWGKGKGAWKTMEVYLVNRDKLMITKSIFVEDAVLKQIVDTLPVNLCLTSGEEMAGFYKDYRGVEVVGASMYIPSMKWALLVEIDKSEVLAPIRYVLINALITASVAIVMIVLLFVVFIRIMVKPLRKISEAAKKIASGNFDVVVPVQARDEIGVLCESFNYMAHHIKARTTALIKSETMFKTLFESNPDGIVILNREGHIIRISKQGETMFGYTRDELLNQTIEVLVPERFRERHLKHRNGYFAEPSIRAMGMCLGISARRKDGSEFSVDIMLSPLYANTEMCVICVVRDVTERVQMEKAIRERALQQEAVASLSQRGLEGIDLLSLMNETVTLVARILNVEYSKILELLPDGKSLFLRAGVGWKHGLVGHAIIDAGVHSQAGYTLLSQEPVVVEDLRTEKRFNGPPLLLDHGVVSGMSVIIHGHNKPYGVFGAHTTQRRTFSKDDIHFLKSVANMIGMAIERDRAEKTLKNSEASLTNAQRIAHLGNWEWNIVTNELRWSEEIYRIFGLTPQSFSATYEAFLNSVHPDDREFVKKSVNDTLYEKMPYSIDHRIVLPDGSERIVHEQAEVIFDSAGKAIQMNGTVQDVTERKRAEEEIRRLFTAIDQSINNVFITDAKGQIEYVNSTFEQVTGYAKEEVIGQNTRILASGETTHAEYEELWKTILAGKTWRGIFKNKKKDGHLYWCNGLITPIKNEKGQITHFLAIQEDITEKIKTEERLKHIASYDELTGILNRTCFMEQLDEWLSYNKAYNQTGVLLLMDIDGFRLINDTYGHSIGDNVLHRVAEFLITALFEIDKHYVNRDVKESILGRLGGDEFAIFLPARDEKEGMETAEEISKKLEKSRFVEIPGHLTASIGVALYPRDGSTTKELLTSADASTYHAKGIGYNRIHLYNTEDLVLEKTHSRMEWKGRIQKAIEEDRFEPWFQPILDLKDNQIHHCEALARIRDTNGEIILPGAFVDTAETFGLITAIDRIIINKTLKTQSNLCKQGKVLSFSMNLSGKDLDDKELLQFLKSVIIETGADPKHLIFEITETAAIRDLDRAIKFIRELKAIGCSFALDDFGVGFTSFKYLKEMEVDYIKIDGSFIRTLHETTNDHIFVKAIADVARGMGIKTIAEFVENNEIIKILKEYGVDYGQGYFIGKPSPSV